MKQQTLFGLTGEGKKNIYVGRGTFTKPTERLVEGIGQDNILDRHLPSDREQTDQTFSLLGLSIR